MPSQRAGASNAGLLSRLLRDLRHPDRLQRNPLVPGVAEALGTPNADALRKTIEVQLRRLPPRQRAILERYELQGEPLADLLQALALSRRQFFRDRQAGLASLAVLVLGAHPAEAAVAVALPQSAVREPSVGREDAVSLVQSAITGLRHAGAVAAAVERLRALVPELPTRSARIDALLQIAEISMEYGDRPAERQILEQLRANDANGGDALDGLRSAIRCLIVESDLVGTCDEAVALNDRASTLLRRSLRNDGPRRDVVLLVGCLCLLYYDYERASYYAEARAVVAEAIALVRRFSLDLLPIGVEARIALAYSNARQFGNVGDALDSLRDPLDRCLVNGWSALAARIAVACLSLSVMRSRYAEAMQWYDWLSSVSAARLPQFDRKTLVIDASHAMTMLGNAHRAICMLNSSRDEGYVYVPTVKLRRAEALEALGDLRGAIRDATDALEGSERAHYTRGIARSKRVLASCYDAMGATRLARRHLDECLTLSERSQSAYDLLRAMVTKSHVLKDERSRNDAIELARLLIEAGGHESCTPPSQPLA